MIKFLQLVKNEIIKLSLKMSTVVLLTLLIVMSAGFCLLFYFREAWTGVYYLNGEDDSGYYQRQLEEVEAERFDGWEIEAERLRFLSDNGIDFDDWRYSHVTRLFETQFNEYMDSNGFLPEGRRAELDEAKSELAGGDWVAFYRRLIAENEKKYGSALEKELIDLYNWEYLYSIENDVSPADETQAWKRKVISALLTLKINIYSTEEENPELNNLREQAAVYEYRLEHDIARDVSALLDEGYDDGYDVWFLIHACLSFIPFMSVLIIIIAGGIVASEFTGGTIKFLLINPVKRWKILVSKYIVTLIAGAAFLSVMFLIFWLLGLALTGFENANAVYLQARDGVVSSMPALLKFIQVYALGSVNILVMATLAFAISSTFRSAGLAIAISISALIGGSIINQILLVLQADWGRFLIFANADLVHISKGVVMYEGQTLTFAVGVIAVHMVVFLLTAWDGFTRREI